MKSLVLLLLIIGCQLKKEESAPQRVQVSVPAKQKYEGIYYFDNASSFELQSNSLDELFVYTTGQSVKTLNADATYAFHPTISGLRLRETNGELFWSATVTYSAANNVKEDVSNVLLNGAKLTEFHFRFNAAGEPSLTIVIYSGNLVVVNRTIDEAN